jgi:hypothetical protein
MKKFWLDPRMILQMRNQMMTANLNTRNLKLTAGKLVIKPEALTRKHLRRKKRTKTPKDGEAQREITTMRM